MKTKAALGLLLAIGSVGAQAGTILLDDFSLNQAIIAAPPLPSTSVSGAGTAFASRTLSFSAVTGSVGTNQLEVTGGSFYINTGGASSSTASVSWLLNAATVTALTGATWFTVTLEQQAVDAGTVTVGGNLRTTGGNGTFAVVNRAVLGNPFAITFESTVNADSRWDNAVITFSCRVGAREVSEADARQQGGCPSTNVPEPGTIALLGLGLLGAGALRRKSK